MLKASAGAGAGARAQPYVEPHVANVAPDSTTNSQIANADGDVCTYVYPTASDAGLIAPPWHAPELLPFTVASVWHETSDFGLALHREAAIPPAVHVLQQQVLQPDITPDFEQQRVVQPDMKPGFEQQQVEQLDMKPGFNPVAHGMKDLDRTRSSSDTACTAVTGLRCPEWEGRVDRGKGCRWAVLRCKVTCEFMQFAAPVVVPPRGFRRLFEPRPEPRPSTSVSPQLPPPEIGRAHV